MMTTTPASALDELNDLAPLGDFAAAAGAAVPVDAAVLEVADADDDALELLPLAALLTAAVTSIGIINGLLPAFPRLTEPSDPITSGLEARKVRVYITFSAIDDCAQEGSALISMLEPHEAAAVLLAVCMLVYDPMAAMVESFIIEGIMDETAVGEPAALGGLMIPNMPFGQ